MCFKKCVPRYHDQDLNTAESVCADRCVGKYIDVRAIQFDPPYCILRLRIFISNQPLTFIHFLLAQATNKIGEIMQKEQADGTTGM
jgi:Tim10/DDP family zinc finger